MNVKYQEPENINKKKVFLINRSRIEDRLDPSIYQESFRYVSNIYPNVKLSEIAYINPDTSFSQLTDDEYISFIPMENLNEVYGEVESKDIKYVRDTIGYTRFQEGDLLWAKITPCMQNGKSAIASNLINGLGCGSTEFHIIRTKGNEVLIEYIHYLLHSRKVLESAKNYFGGAAGQQRVSASFLKNFSTPLPPIDIQKKIIQMTEKSLCEDSKK